MGKISDLVLYKDHHLLALNKPAGMPAQEDPSGDPSLHRLAMAYAHRDLYLVHRLDRRVSGVMVFVKTKAAAAHLARQWDAHSVSKTYLAIVSRDENLKATTLTHFLTYDKSQGKTIAHAEQTEGADEAVLSLTPVHYFDQYMLVRIDLHTGRKHQIRAQLAAIGLPVKGDVKYGAKRTNAEGNIDLHAYALGLIHPSTHAPLRLVAPLPATGLWALLDAGVVDGI